MFTFVDFCWKEQLLASTGGFLKLKKNVSEAIAATTGCSFSWRIGKWSLVVFVYYIVNTSAEKLAICSSLTNLSKTFKSFE